MKTVEQIAQALAPGIQQNNRAIGETNRRIVKIGDGQGNAQPAILLTPRDVFYRSSLDQNDRGVAILSSRCPIPISSIDGYYDVDVWLANVPGSDFPMIVDLADTGGFSTGGPTPAEAAANAAAFPDQSRLVLFYLRPSSSGGISVYVDVGPYAVAYETSAGGTAYFRSVDFAFPDPTDSLVFDPAGSALTSGQHCLIGIALDPTSGSLVAIQGTPVTAGGSLPSRNEFSDSDYEAIDFTGKIPAGFIYAYYGQTDLAEDDCVRAYDPRLIVRAAGASGGAPVTGKYILQQPDAHLTNAQALSALSTGLLKNTTSTGVLSIAGASDLPAHASRHQSGGADSIALDTLAAPTDNTNLNVSTTAHGLMPKLPNNPALFADGVGGYSNPAASGATNVVYTNAYASPPSSPNNGDWWIPSDGLGVYFARVSSAWVHLGLIQSPLTEPVTTGFAWTNQASSTVSLDKAVLRLRMPSVSGGANGVAVYSKTIPAAPYTVITSFRLLINQQANTSASTYYSGGLVLRESSSGKLIFFEVSYAASAPTTGLTITKWTNPTTYAGSNYYAFNQNWMPTPYWIRIRDDNTSRYFEVSIDGQIWETLYHVSRTDYITPDQIGFAMRSQFDANGGAVNVLVHHYQEA